MVSMVVSARAAAIHVRSRVAIPGTCMLGRRVPLCHPGLELLFGFVAVSSATDGKVWRGVKDASFPTIADWEFLLLRRLLARSFVEQHLSSDPMRDA